MSTPTSPPTFDASFRQLSRFPSQQRIPINRIPILYTLCEPDYASGTREKGLFDVVAAQSWVQPARGLYCPPAHNMSFELSGAIVAFEHLRATYTRSPHQHHRQQLDSEQISDITQSMISCFTVFRFEPGMSSPVGVLIQISAMFDILDSSAYDGVARDVEVSADLLACMDESIRLAFDVRVLKACILQPATANDF
ncbi:hypothetical protein BT96DRAFT_1023742 [Gymnopus androsaceus JB14]|uniref:Uncharacterized protein n=1 Tax=Gymnopus androsaceus JB14 TaxID=1447944 RepID=A0A6A4H223_9AGAR|nr:hypothetical protein BT96DRAFT_1023742 [Gymnopus androsaceus JB14]